MKPTSTITSNLQTLVNDTTSATLTLLKQWMNDTERIAVGSRGGSWRFLEVIKTIATVASQSSYRLPASIRKLMDLWVLVGTTKYMPRIVHDFTYWKRVLASNYGESDAPYFAYIQNRNLLLEPAPASSSNTIYLRGRKKFGDLGFPADYTTGTITSLANAGTALVAAGTTFTEAMVGRYIKIPISQGGDDMWYEIGAFVDATHLTLAEAYEGTSIVAATATYTIAEFSVFPEAYEDLLMYRPAAIYFMMNQRPDLARTYWMMYDGGLEAGFSKVVGGLLAQMYEQEGSTVESNYEPPLSDFQIPNPNFPPQTIPGSSFT